MNAIKLTMRGERGVNDANDVHRIVDEVRKLKDDLHRVWIKNHNMKATLASVKLFVVTNLVCAIFMFVTTMLFLLNKKKNIVNVFPSIVKMHTNPYQSYRKHAT
jgi:hypothetical protein